MSYNPLLMCDFYKTVHSEMYPKDIGVIYSVGTPRVSRLDDVEMIPYFGGQAFCKEFLIKAFNEDFFARSEEEVVADYERTLTYSLGEGTYNSDKVRQLHRLGYLPLAMYAIPEGKSTVIGVPQVAFVNTHRDFAWLTNAIETAWSTYIWHIQVAATVGQRYRKIAQRYRNLSCDNFVKVSSLLGDFSMRGQHSAESATKASAAWLLSFVNTATIPAIKWLEDNYDIDISKEVVGKGAISTEHSVMCSNYSVDGDEITFIKRLLTEIYPHQSFSMVSDSYDYWNLVTNILPQLKEEILAHDGCLAIRGDSGDPVEIVAGKEIIYLRDDKELFVDKDYTNEWLSKQPVVTETAYKYYSINGKLYFVTFDPEWGTERGAITDKKYYFIDRWNITWTEIEPTAEIMGTVWALDQIFGHTINSKGYKVLNPHIKTLYGDSITPQRCEEIYRRLTAAGYAINNVSLGVGSFSFMCLEEYMYDGSVNYKPFTRDTFGYAIKATYGELRNGTPVMIQKAPKALSWKKSPKGCIEVSLDGKSYTDGHTFAEAHVNPCNLMQRVFVDGRLEREMFLGEIRNNMYPEGFNN